MKMKYQCQNLKKSKITGAQLTMDLSQIMRDFLIGQNNLSDLWKDIGKK
jgi:hypothetical protein